MLGLSSSTLFLLGLGSVAIALVCYEIVAKKRLPPGPLGIPVLGNIFDLPSEYPWLTFSRLSAKYGDVISFRAVGQTIVVLNSSKATRELLEDRSLIYSGRPVFPMLGDLMGWNWAIQFMQYGPEFLRHRKPLARTLGPAALVDYRPTVEKETHMLLIRLLENPEQFLHLLQRAAAGITIAVLYGQDEGPVRDAIIEVNEKATDGFIAAGNVGDHAVDIFPILKHVPEWILPGGGFKRKARKLRELSLQMINMPFEHVKQEMRDGTAKPCVIVDLLEQNLAGDKSIDEQVVKATGGVFWLGGADTQLASLYSFVLAMALNPDVQRKAQREIDAAVGEDRFPTFDDRSALPYMECIIKEVQRWNPVAPLGIPHAVTKDDVYRSYLIPKGAIIMSNAWAILHDREIYPEPFEFRPERYTDPNPGPDPRTWAFGSGRRTCPGRYYADHCLWFMFSSILATFEIGKAFDEHGQEIFSPGHYTTGVASRPKPFRCSFTPRPSRAVLLKRELQVQ